MAGEYRGCHHHGNGAQAIHSGVYSEKQENQIGHRVFELETGIDCRQGKRYSPDEACQCLEKHGREYTGTHEENCGQKHDRAHGYEGLPGAVLELPEENQQAAGYGGSQIACLVVNKTDAADAAGQTAVTLTVGNDGHAGDMTACGHASDGVAHLVDHGGELIEGAEDEVREGKFGDQESEKKNCPEQKDVGASASPALFHGFIGLHRRFFQGSDFRFEPGELRLGILIKPELASGCLFLVSLFHFQLTREYQICRVAVISIVPMKPEREPHLEMQKRYFDQRVDFFCQPIPESIQERTGQIVASSGLEKDSAVLDVGTGIGVLIGHFLEEGLHVNKIVGCDLSSRMLARARKKYPEVHFWLGDIVDLSIPLPPDFPAGLKSFSFVFFNACFGNMFDQVEALKAASRLTRGRGTIVISHPLGAAFVDSLHRSEPEIVPHPLPSLDDYQSWAKTVGYEIDHFDDRPGFYLARLVCDRKDGGD